MSSSPRNVTSTQKTEIPEWQRPYMEEIFSEAKGLYHSDQPQYFPGQTFVSRDPLTQMGLDAQTAYALGNPVPGQATGYLSNVLGGGYLGQNPYAQNAYDAAAQAVTRNYQDVVRPGIDSRAALRGRLGSNAYATQLDTGREALGRSLNQLAQPFFFDQYNQERNRQQQALQLAPGIQQLGLSPAGLLQGVGAQNEAYGMQQLQDQINRFNFQQQLPFSKLGQYLGYVGGNVGSSSTSTQPIFQNRGAQGLGLGLSLIGNMVMPGMGGLLGGLGGMASGGWGGGAGGAVPGGFF